MWPHNIIHCKLKGCSSVNFSFKPAISGLLYFKLIWNETRHMNGKFSWQRQSWILEYIVVLSGTLTIRHGIYFHGLFQDNNSWCRGHNNGRAYFLQTQWGPLIIPSVLSEFAMYGHWIANWKIHQKCEIYGII